VYYSHIQRIYNHLNKEAQQKQSDVTENKFKSHVSLYEKKYKIRSNEGSLSNREAELMLEKHQKSETEFLSKVENKIEQVLGSMTGSNIPKLNAPNHSDLTDLNSTKSGRMMSKNTSDSNTKLAVGATDTLSHKVEKISLKKIRSVNSINMDRSKSGQENSINKAKDTPGKTGIIDKIERRPSGVFNADRIAISKEVSIGNLNEISQVTSNNLFLNDLSCIKNHAAILRKNEHSEIYDQWVDESK
jgi:hypothetical protein